MKIVTAIFATLLLLAGGPAAAEVKGPAPQFTLPGTSGEINLADYKGKVVYLDFWASWCSPCRDSFPWMNKMQAKYQEKGVVFLAVNVDRKKKDAEDFLVNNPAKFPVVFDPKGTVPKLYDVMGMPTAFLIGKDGNIRHFHIGFHETDIAEYEKHIVEALAK